MTCSPLRRFLLGLTVSALLLSLAPSTWAQTMTRQEIVRQYRKARRLMKQDRQEQASQLLFDIVENGAEAPRFRRFARLRLAQSLFKQELHLVAISNVVTILKNTPVNKPSSTFRRALRGLVLIAEKINDESLILNMLRQIPRLKRNVKLPPDQDPINFLLNPTPKDKRRSWWPQFRNSFAFFMGRNAFAFGPRYFARAHRFLKLVKPNAQNHYYAKSVYIRGVMTSWVGKFLRSLKYFRQVLKLKPAKKNDLVLARIHEEAQYGIARNYYAMGRSAQINHQGNPQKHKKETYTKLYRRTLIEYNRIPKTNKLFQDKVLFETAYTYFMMEQYHFALGKLIALNSPYYRTGFFPELDILRALIFFRTCKYESTKETVVKFLKQYSPLSKRLKQLLANRRQKKWRAQYYDYFLRQFKAFKEKKKTDIPYSVISVLSKSKSLRNYEQLMRQLNEERKLIRGKSSTWRESNIGKQMLARVVNLLGSLRRLAGISIRSNLSEINREVGRQLNQARFIQLETLQKQKKELERFAEGGGIEQDEIRYTIVTEQNYIYWPFQGEFWRDEIGYYRQFIQGECKR